MMKRFHACVISLFHMLVEVTVVQLPGAISRHGENRWH